MHDVLTAAARPVVTAMAWISATHASLTPFRSAAVFLAAICLLLVVKYASYRRSSARTAATQARVVTRRSPIDVTREPWFRRQLAKFGELTWSDDLGVRLTPSEVGRVSKGQCLLLPRPPVLRTPTSDGIADGGRERTLASDEEDDPPLLALPNELLVHIGSYLDSPRDVARLAAACRRLRDISSDNGIWRALAQRRWGHTRALRALTRSEAAAPPSVLPPRPVVQVPSDAIGGGLGAAVRLSPGSPKSPPPSGLAFTAPTVPRTYPGAMQTTGGTHETDDEADGEADWRRLYRVNHLVARAGGVVRRIAWNARIAEDSNDHASVRSHFGGRPLLRRGEAIPTCGRCDRPLTFFVQVALNELPAQEVLNARFGDGLLQLFVCTAGCHRGEPFDVAMHVRIVPWAELGLDRRGGSETAGKDPLAIAGGVGDGDFAASGTDGGVDTGAAPFPCFKIVSWEDFIEDLGEYWLMTGAPASLQRAAIAEATSEVSGSDGNGSPSTSAAPMGAGPSDRRVQDETAAAAAADDDDEEDGVDYYDFFAPALSLSQEDRKALLVDLPLQAQAVISRKRHPGERLRHVDLGAFLRPEEFMVKSVGHGDKLGGYPAYLSPRRFPVCPAPACARRMSTCVFQVCSEHHIPWLFGSCGVGVIVQCPAHKDQVTFLVSQPNW